MANATDGRYGVCVLVIQATVLLLFAGLWVTCTDKRGAWNATDAFHLQEARSTQLRVPAFQSYSIDPASCNYESFEFDDIYSKRVWGHSERTEDEYLKPKYYYSYGDWERTDAQRHSLSGPGSDIGDQTRVSLELLTKVVKEHHIRTMLDLPCGDANWQFESWEIDSLDAYVGLDIARSVISLNQQRFRHHINKVFAPWDFAVCPLPKLRWSQTDSNHNGSSEPFDLIHVRDVIQHLPLQRGLAALCNVAKSGARYLISTTYPMPNNTDIPEADWYKNNLYLPPFNFPTGQYCVQTHPDHEEDYSCLWAINDLKGFVDTSCP